MDDQLERVESLWERTKSAAMEALVWSRKISLIGKLKMEHAKLLRDRAESLQEMGERVYTLLKEGRFQPLELQELTEKIDQIDHQLDKLRYEIDKAMAATESSQLEDI